MKRKNLIYTMLISVFLLGLAVLGLIDRNSVALADEALGSDATTGPAVTMPAETPTPSPTPLIPVTGISTQYKIKSIIPDKVVNKKTNLNISGTYDLWLGDKMSLYVTVTPDNASDKTVLYSSSNTAIATVSEKGVVTVKGMGDTTITISSAMNPEISQSFYIHCNYKTELNVVSDLGAVPGDDKSDLSAFKIAFAQGQFMLPGDELKITIPEGTYDIDGTIYAYSNTKVTLAENTTIKRESSADGKIMLKSKTFETIYGYDQICNFSMSGGVWDGNSDGSASSDLLYFGHGKNISLSDMTVKNGCGEHLIELAGIDTAEVKNVKLGGYVLPKTATAYTPKKEAIQLDYCSASSTPSMKPHDYTACKNITITDCSISNCMCGIGAHGYLPDVFLDNIVITNNSFTDITNVCVDSMNFSNLTVENNRAVGFNEFVFAYESDGKIKDNIVENHEYKGLIEKPLNTANGIEVIDSEFLIDSNTLDGQKANGIYVGTDAEVTVTGNKIKNSGKYGVYTYKATATYTSNAVSGSGKGVYHTDKEAEISFSDDIRAYYVSLKKEYPYTGKQIKPIKKIDGLNKKYYTITYKNNKKKGKATVIIKGKGKVKKSMKLYFNIVKKK